MTNLTLMLETTKTKPSIKNRKITKTKERVMSPSSPNN